MKDVIIGNAGQVLGPVTGIPIFNTALDSVLGPPLTAIIDTLSTNASTAVTTATASGSSIPLLTQGKAQITSLFSTLNSAFTTINTELTKLDSNIKGMPGLIGEGLNSLAADARSGQLGQPIKDAIANVSTEMQA